MPDVEKSLGEITNALEENREKWEIVRKANKEVLMKVGLVLEQKVTNSGGPGSGLRSAVTSSDSLIRSNLPVDTRSAFLERESSMLEV